MRTHVVKALASVVALVAIIVLGLGLALTPEPATAAPECVVQVQGTVGVVVCAGVTVAQIPLPTVTLPGATITLPAVTLPPITLPAETVTVQVPGGTQTVTQTVNSTETETITATVTAKPSESNTQVDTGEAPQSSQPTSLPSVTPTETGQNPQGDGIIGDNNDDEPLVDLGDGETTVVEATLGLLATIALVALMVFTLWAGFVLGYKNKEQKDTTFMRALLEQARIGQGKHR